MALIVEADAVVQRASDGVGMPNRSSVYIEPAVDSTGVELAGADCSVGDGVVFNWLELICTNAAIGKVVFSN